ncbi:MAG: hypothetical protein K5979_04055 [Ruminococcus sp.]|nr:hypothetical protein [Ruminococcus sp.]
MEKNKGLGILKLLVTIICICAVIVSLAVNILFSKGSTPNLFGRYIYVVGDLNPMQNEITTGAALIAKDAKDVSLAVGDIVLCYPADNPDKLSLRSINYIVDGDDGTSRYYTKDSVHEDTTDSIPKDKVAAICTGYPESIELGGFIRFAQGVKGIIFLLVIPSILLVIMVITGVAKSIGAKGDDDDDMEFYKYEEAIEKAKRNAKNAPKPNGGDPLFEPEHDNFGSSELEIKKMSIAEHFSQKEVNHDSPYQKERERTMQFKTQKGSLTGTMSFPAGGGSAETSFAARNIGTQSSTAPTADALREEMLRKTAEAERSGAFSIKSNNAAASAPDNTGILSAAQLEELTRSEAPKYTAPKPSRPAPAPTPARTVKKSSSPDISDILEQTDMARKSKDPADMSVDDLLKMIENEKKKL